MALPASVTTREDKAEAVTAEMSRAIQVLTLTLMALGGAVAAGIVQIASLDKVAAPGWARTSLILEGMATILGFASLWVAYLSLRKAFLANALLIQGKVSPQRREKWNGFLQQLARLNSIRFVLVPIHGLTCVLGTFCYAVALVLQLESSAIS